MAIKLLITFFAIICFLLETISTQTEVKKEERKLTYSEIINKDYVKINFINF